MPKKNLRGFCAVYDQLMQYVCICSTTSKHFCKHDLKGTIYQLYLFVYFICYSSPAEIIRLHCRIFIDEVFSL